MRVAPYMGAWIETVGLDIYKPVKIVAPYMGAWIETFALCASFAAAVSHPIWVRGLKQRKNRP